MNYVSYLNGPWMSLSITSDQHITVFHKLSSSWAWLTERIVTCCSPWLILTCCCFFFSGTRRHLSEFKSAEVVVTSLGRSRLHTAVRLCTKCQSEFLLFPFDRIHCSIQLVPDSPATQLAQPPPNVNLIPLIDSRVKSWTSCRYIVIYSLQVCSRYGFTSLKARHELL